MFDVFQKYRYDDVSFHKIKSKTVESVQKDLKNLTNRTFVDKT